jgi:cytoskeletal protein RodZ
MKEIGDQLKIAREAIGLTIEEAADDLKVSPSQLKSLEEGDKQSSKDILNLKQLIKSYAKYLGLEYEKIEEEFNEFVFEYTSKIPLEKIAQANKEKDKERGQIKRVTSPYTIKKQTKISMIPVLVLVLIIISIIFIYFFMG